MRQKISTGLTIHKNLILSTIGDSSVSASVQGNALESSPGDNSGTGWFQLTRHHVKAAGRQYLLCDIAGVLCISAQQNVARSERRAIGCSL